MSAALKQAAQSVLDRWDSPQWEWAKHGPTADLMAELRKALEAKQAQQEPVAIVMEDSGQKWARLLIDMAAGAKLYAAPQQAQATTPEMLRAGQMTEAGGYICATYSGGYTLLTELYAAMAKAAQPVQQAQAPGWMPIETAPKDYVTEFDGWNGERVPNVSWAHPQGAANGEYDWCVSEYISGWGHQNTRVRGLTHWMPLPPAPQGDKT